MPNEFINAIGHDSNRLEGASCGFGKESMEGFDSKAARASNPWPFFASYRSHSGLPNALGISNLWVAFLTQDLRIQLLLLVFVTCQQREKRLKGSDKWCQNKRQSRMTLPLRLPSNYSITSERPPASSDDFSALVVSLTACRSLYFLTHRPFYRAVADPLEGYLESHGYLMTFPSRVTRTIYLIEWMQ